MKKLLAIILSIGMLFSTASMVLASDTDAEVGNPRAEFLKTVHVMTALPSNYEAYVSRAEFALYAAKMIGVSEYGTAEERLFLDLPMDHWATYAIHGLVEAGIISPHPEGKFRPDDAITMDEALKILVCALGYQPYAEGYGGFPTGYIKAAKQCGLILGNYNGGNVTYAAAVDLLYDALNTELLEGVRYDSDGIVYAHTKGETPLSVYFDIYSIRGTVYAMDGITMNADYFADFGQINVAGKTATYEGDPFAYIGRCVTMFYEQRGDARPKAVHIVMEEADNDVTTINRDDFIHYDAATGTVRYYSGDKERTLRTGGNLSVIKNGDTISTGLETAINGVTKGVYLFIDNEDDGSNDTLVISEYRNLVVNYVDTKDGLVYDKYDTAKPLKIDQTGTKKILIYKDSASVALADIAVGDVITVFDSANYLRIYISTSTISGQVSAIKKSYDTTKVEISGKWYEVDPDFASYTGMTLRLGMEGTFVTDLFDKIAYMDAGNLSGSDTLGYIIDYTSFGTFEDTVKLRLFVPSVGIAEYDLDSKTVIDGTAAKTESEKLTALGKNDGEVIGQVIFFRAADGVISHIDTPYYDKVNENEDSIKPSATAEDVNYRQRKFGKSIICNDSTLLLGVPTDANLKTAEEYDFHTPALSGVSISQKFAPEAYKFDLESGFDDVVVLKNYISGTTSDELVVVNSLMQAYKDGSSVECLSYYQDGSEHELYVDDEVQWEKDTGKIQKSMTDAGIKTGDVLRIGRDAKGDIISYRIIFSYKASPAISDVGEVNQTNNFNVNDRVVAGFAKSTRDGVLKVYRDKAKPNAIDEVFNLNDVTVTVFDSNADKGEELSSGTYHEIATYDNTLTPALVIIRTYQAQMKDVIVFQ